MKKFFTLAIAAAAAMSVSAAPTHPAVFSKVDFNLGQIERVNPLAEVQDHFASRGDDVDLTGKYALGTYFLVPNPQNDKDWGEFIENYDEGFEIVADPDNAPNGYIIKNFFAEFFNAGQTDESKLIKVGDVKAEYDPAQNTLTIPAYQYVFTTDARNEDGSLTPIQIHIIGVDEQQQKFTSEAPVVFDVSYGMLTMKSWGFMFGEIVVDEKGEGAYGFGYQFGQVTAFVPNGTYTVYSAALADTYEFPIYGVWKENRVNTTAGAYMGTTQFYVVNFTGFDALRVLPVMKTNDANKVLIDGVYGYTGWQLMYAPFENAALNYNNQYFAAEIDDRSEPIGDGYQLYGTVEELTNEKVRVSFPTYGLFTKKDEMFGGSGSKWEDGVLEFEPNAIAGIENVAVAADNTNAAPVYYNLQGMRVNNPANGIFIRVQGNETSKVLVK